MNQLYEAQAIAQAEGRKIDEAILLRTMPPEAERLKIAEDIRKGQRALRKFDLSEFDQKSDAPPEEQSEHQSGAKRLPPFQRKPQRRSTGMDHIAVDAALAEQSDE